jgi:stage II sporulation protein M
VGMSVVVILLLRVGNSIFNREELLGRTIDQLNLKGTFSKIWKNIRSVDAEGTPARNLIEWYRDGVLVSVRRLGPAIWITVGLFIAAVIAGYIIGQQPEWRIPLARDLNLGAAALSFERFLHVPTQTGALMLIVWQNGRILLAATILAIFTFGVGALILTPAVYVILGYVFSQVILAGYNPAFLFAGVLTHGIIEIPVIVLATAAALRMGAVVTRPPQGETVGQGWMSALGDTIKIGFGLVVPGLILAALLEAFVTPIVVLAVMGG